MKHAGIVDGLGRTIIVDEDQTVFDAIYAPRGWVTATQSEADAFFGAPVPDSGLVTTAQLAAAVGVYRKIVNVRPTVVIPLGTSITNGANAVIVNGSAREGQSYVRMLPGLLNGRITIPYNAGVAGNTSTQILARVQSDVIARGAQVCIVEAATNDDFTTGGGRTTYTNNIIAIIAALRAADIVPVLTTAPPVAADSSKAPTANAITRAIAAKYACEIIDFYSATVSTTGGYATGMDGGDGVHPSALGHQAMAVAAASVLDGVVAKGRTWPVVVDNNDPSNLVLTGALLADDGTGKPNGWVFTGSFSSSPGDMTRSMVTTPGVLGKMARTVFPGASGGQLQDSRGMPGGYYADGDTLIVSMYVNIEAASGLSVSAGDGLVIRMQATVGTVQTTKTIGPLTAVTNGPVLVVAEYVVPTGTTFLQMGVYRQLTGGSVATLTCSYGQVAVYKKPVIP